MRNLLTFKVESLVGSIFVLIFSAFLLGIFMIAVQNFGSDAEVLAYSSDIRLRTISPEERALIEKWFFKNNSDATAKDINYRYLVKKYSNKPWLE